MYIANTAPSTLAEMLDFLSPTIANNLFDSVAYDDENNPTKIVCTQNNETILEMTVSSGVWTMTPYIASGVAATGGEHVLTSMRWGFAIRCKGGVAFRSTYVQDGYGYRWYVIAKTSSGKTGFVLSWSGGTATYGMDYNTLYPSCFGDNTDLDLYAHGYKTTTNYYNNHSYDRTILSRIPVVGIRGSNDYFTTALIRSTLQYIETGEQIIAGKRYGCMDLFAILDE